MKQALAIVALFAAIVLFIGSGAFGWLLDLAGGADASAADPAGVVAESGVEALLTVNYEAGVDAWLEKVCAISTEEGCQIAQAMYAKGIQANLETYQVDQTCEARARKMVSETPAAEGNPARQIWAVEIQKSGWGEVMTDITAAVVVLGEDGHWVFETVLPLVPSEELWKLLTPTVPAP